MSKYSEFNKSVGRYLQAQRKKAGHKSARVFAESLGMNVNTYTEYEQGKAGMSYEKACEFSDALQCSLEEFRGRFSVGLCGDSLSRELYESFEKLNPKSKETLMAVVRSMVKDPDNTDKETPKERPG